MISSQNQTDRDHRNTIMEVRNEICMNRIYALFAPENYKGTVWA